MYICSHSSGPSFFPEKKLRNDQGGAGLVSLLLILSCTLRVKQAGWVPLSNCKQQAILIVINYYTEVKNTENYQFQRQTYMKLYSNSIIQLHVANNTHWYSVYQ